MNGSRIAIRKVCDKEDLDEVFMIRQEVFVVEQNCPPELEWEFEDESQHFLATVNGVPAGTARWRHTSVGYKLERFAVLKPFRRQGIAQALLKKLISDLPDPDASVYLHAQEKSAARCRLSECCASHK